MLGCQPSHTPIDTSSKLSSKGEPFVDVTFYCNITGALKYLTIISPKLS
jgi:hypothetical protein